MGELPAFTPAESQLEIVKSDTASEQDVTPLFSPITLALEELQLRQIMNTIQRDGYRYVGITATDPLDTAFLAELVRGHCPNAQLLVVSGSTSFVHPKRRGFLKGALCWRPGIRCIMKHNTGSFLGEPTRTTTSPTNGCSHQTWTARPEFTTPP